MKFKIMEVDREDLQIGDLVLCKNKKNCYFIYGTGKTFFGSHLIVKAIYNSGTYENWIVCDMKPKRIICRLVPEKDDKENEYPEV